MTARQIIRELQKRKPELLEFIKELLIGAGIVEGKVIEIEKVIEKIEKKELTTEQETKLTDKIAELESSIKDEQDKHAETAELIAELESSIKDEQERHAETAKLNAQLLNNVQRNLSDKDRAALRAALNKILDSLAHNFPGQTSERFNDLQVKVSEIKEFKAKMKYISEYDKELAKEIKDLNTQKTNERTGLTGK